MHRSDVMTVGRLIEKLNTLPKDWMVTVGTVDEIEGHPVTSIFMFESNDECQIGYEIAHVDDQEYELEDYQEDNRRYGRGMCNGSQDNFS